MTITYPLTPPASPIHSRIDFELETVVAISESPYSFVSQTQQRAGERWLISVSLPPMTRENAAPWIAFLSKLNGRKGTFYYGSYLMGTPQGLAGGTPLVKGAGQSGQSLDIDGCTISVNFLKAADFFSLDNKLYQNLNDVSADGSGNATLDIRPRLRGHADNTALVTSFPKGIFRLRDNLSRWSESETKHYLVAFTAEEAL